MFTKLIKLRDDQFIMFDQTLPGRRGGGWWGGKFEIFVWIWHYMGLGSEWYSSSRHSSLTASVEFRHQPVSWWLRGNFQVAPLVCRSSIKFDPFEECWQENEKNICIKFYSRFSGTNYSIKLTRLPDKLSKKETWDKNK